MKKLTGLKLSEVVKLYEEGKALECRPTDSISKLFQYLGYWNISEARINGTWDVKLKPQKREITLDQLEQAWDSRVTKIYQKSENSPIFKDIAKELGFDA